MAKIKLFSFPNKNSGEELGEEYILLCLFYTIQTFSFTSDKQIIND